MHSDGQGSGMLKLIIHKPPVRLTLGDFDNHRAIGTIFVSVGRRLLEGNVLLERSSDDDWSSLDQVAAFRLQIGQLRDDWAKEVDIRRESYDYRWKDGPLKGHIRPSPNPELRKWQEHKRMIDGQYGYQVEVIERSLKRAVSQAEEDLLRKLESVDHPIQLLPSLPQHTIYLRGYVWASKHNLTLEQWRKLVLANIEQHEARLAARFAGSQAEGRSHIPAHVRHEVWQRDGGRCAQCGSRERLEFDHIVPVSRGGSSTVRNLELLCEPCNRAKGARL